MNLPRKLYAGPDMDYALNKMQVTFTSSTANRIRCGEEQCKRGHYNAGLEFHSGGYFLDRPDTIVVPLRYQPLKNIGAGVPDQPDTVTFNVTLRRVVNFPLNPGDTVSWELGDQRGTATVEKAGEVTINGLILNASENYTGLGIRKAATGPPIVYIEATRTHGPIPGTGLESGANWDHATDIARLTGGMAETRVVIDYLDGQREVIHDCIDSPDICVIEGARVSPDSKNIAYWRGIGTGLMNVRAWGTQWNTGAKDIVSLKECQLWIYNIASKSKRRISGGHCDRAPDWIDNDTIVFSSNREGTYPEYNTPPGNFYPLKSLHIYRADITGAGLINIENLTPHECMALNPTVLTNGRILYSALQCVERAKETSSPRNHLYIASMNQWGGDSTSAELGFHSVPYLRTHAYNPETDSPSIAGAESVKALRVVAEIEKGKLATANYYRGNHLGAMGVLLGWNHESWEGVLRAGLILDDYSFSQLNGSGRFTPKTLHIKTPFGQSQDAPAKRHKNGKIMGKAGYPAAHPGGKYMFTWGRGECYEDASNRNSRTYTGGEPTCQKVIALALVDIIKDPFDPKQLKILSQANDYHRWGAQAIVPYRDKYGQSKPAQIPRFQGDRTGLAIVDVYAHEVFPIPGKESAQQRITFQGNIQPNYKADFYQFCIQYIQPARRIPDESGYQYMEKDCAIPEADGSLYMDIDPDRTFQMLATDKSGNELSRDHRTHSLRKGEIRTCHGCHDGHSESRTQELGRSAVERFITTEAGR